MLTKRIPPDSDVPRHPLKSPGQASGLEYPVLGRVPAFGNTHGNRVAQIIATQREDVIARFSTYAL